MLFRRRRTAAHSSDDFADRLADARGAGYDGEISWAYAGGLGRLQKQARRPRCEEDEAPDEPLDGSVETNRQRMEDAS